MGCFEKAYARNDVHWCKTSPVKWMRWVVKSAVGTTAAAITRGTGGHLLQSTTTVSLIAASSSASGAGQVICTVYKEMVSPRLAASGQQSVLVMFRVSASPYVSGLMVHTLCPQAFCPWLNSLLLHPVFITSLIRKSRCAQGFCFWQATTASCTVCTSGSS